MGDTVCWFVRGGPIGLWSPPCSFCRQASFIPLRTLDCEYHAGSLRNRWTKGEDTQIRPRGRPNTGGARRQLLPSIGVVATAPERLQGSPMTDERERDSDEDWAQRRSRFTRFQVSADSHVHGPLLKQ
jgi:hypothetical protein